MLIPTIELLNAAQTGGYAIGAFNIYNLEGVKAVVAAAEAERSPAMLQILPSALKQGETPLIALALSAAREAATPMSVHLDHCPAADVIRAALNAGLTSIMADGSHLAYEDNLAFSRQMAGLAHQHGGIVEAELGKLTGTEDGLTVPEWESKLTDPAQAAEFVAQTGIDALAVCIGNVHGNYRDEPRLDFDRLAKIHTMVDVPLVMHGASGLPETMIQRSIELGITKFNVNTEVRQAYLSTLKLRLNAPNPPDLLGLMADSITAMQAIIAEKLRLFGSAGRA